MGFDDGKILLDSENGAYYAGQTIFGKLKFHQDKVKTFRGIYVKAKGFAHVHWSTSHTRKNGDQRETYHVNHDAHEDYFHTQQYLVGGKSGEYKLEPGDHEFEFQCHIPPHCPSSYEGTHGHIRYQLKVVVDRAFRTDQEKEAIIRVIAPLDLNLNPQNREPIQLEFNESYCCFCMSSGSCETVVKLPVTGYSVGQLIPVEIGCENKGNVEIDHIKLKILKKTTYHAHDAPGTEREEETVQEVSKGPVGENTNRSWTVEMEVPVMDVNNVSACRIIDIDYYFQVKVCPSGCHENSDSTTAIAIGDVPLKGFQDDGTNRLQDQIPNQPIPQTAYPAVNNSFPGPQAITTQPFGNVPYPGPQHPGPNVYPNPNQPPIVSPFPGNTPYSGGNLPTAVGNPNFPGGNPAFPGANPYFPGANPPFPGANPSFPGANPSFPGANPPFPGANPSFPGANPSFLGANPPFPGANPSFPRANPPFPGANPSFPGANPSFPGGNPPYPGGNPPYPIGNPPYPGGNVPMPMPTQPPRSPMGFRTEKSENQEAAPLIPYPSTFPRPVSPFLSATDPAIDVKSSEGTPIKVPDTPTLLPQSPYNPEFMSSEK